MFYYSPESQKKISQLEHLLKLSEEKQRELDKEIVEKSELISELKLQIWQNEKKHLELIKAKDQQVLTLKLELDAKSNTIASLTTDIHRLKVDQMTLSKPNTPPSRESSGRQRSRRSSVKALDVASRPVTAKLGTAPPDAEMFLVQACSNKLDSQQVSMKPTPPILPPISNNDQLSLFNRRQTLIRRKLDLKSQPELTTLAVDQLASSSNTFIHEPKATTE